MRCFSRIDFVVIPFDIELPWYNTQFRGNPPSQAAYCREEVPANMFFCYKDIRNKSNNFTMLSDTPSCV